MKLMNRINALPFVALIIYPLLLASQGLPDTKSRQSEQSKSGQYTRKEPIDLETETRVNEIASEVSDLKEKVYRSKAKLKLLEETLLLGKITGSKAIIRFKNNTGGLFKISEGEYYLNGKLAFKLSPSKDQKDEFIVFDGEAPPRH